MLLLCQLWRWVAGWVAVAPLISFTYDLNGPDGGGEAYSDLQVALAARAIDSGGDSSASSHGIDWRVHMEGFGSRDTAGNLWVDGAGLMDALQCAFGWRATDDEIDELLEAAGSRAGGGGSSGGGGATSSSSSSGDGAEYYRLDPEGYITVMQDFEEDFGTGALGSPASSSEEQPPPAWREHAALAVDEGYSS